MVAGACARVGSHGGARRGARGKGREARSVGRGTGALLHPGWTCTVRATALRPRAPSDLWCELACFRQGCGVCMPSHIGQRPAPGTCSVAHTDTPSSSFCCLVPGVGARCSLVSIFGIRPSYCIGRLDCLAYHHASDYGRPLRACLLCSPRALLKARAPVL